MNEYYNPYYQQPIYQQQYDKILDDKMSREMERLAQMRNQLRANQPTPVTNIINTQTQPKVELEAKILTDGQTAKDVIVANKTVFIDEKNKKVSIKEEDGTISKEYELVIPLTAEQKEILELKQANSALAEKLKNAEVLLNEYEFAKSNKSIINEQQSINVNDESSKSTTKKSSK